MRSVYFEMQDVSTRLTQLGLDDSLLQESVRQAHLFRARITPNHPRIYPGLVMWGEIVAALRNVLRPRGWYRPEVGNYELTVNDDLNLAIAVASGDEATGTPYGNPSNRSPKGKNTVEAVEANRQLDMFSDLLPELSQADDSDTNQQTWVLLHFTDAGKQEIRLELSRPSAIGDDGKISDWSERIILGSIPTGDDDVSVESPQGPDIDFDVRRKIG